MSVHRRNRAALLGAIVTGVLAATMITFSILGQEDLGPREERLGSLAMALLVLSPAAISAYVWARPGSHSEGPLLVAACFASVACAFVTIFSFGLLWLPSIIILGIASILANWKSASAGRMVTLLLGAGIAGVLLSSAWFALIVHEDPMCWALRVDEQGNKSWHEMPSWIEDSSPDFNASMSLGPNELSGRCTSNATTPIEGAIALSLIGSGLVLLWVLSLPKARPEPEA